MNRNTATRKKYILNFVLKYLHKLLIYISIITNHFINSGQILLIKYKIRFYLKGYKITISRTEII
jgi:hypothetical protein